MAESQDQNKHGVLRLILTFVFGNPETRTGTAVILAALPMLNAPWWQPLLASVLKTYTDIDTTLIEQYDQKLFWGGWLVLAIGLAIYFHVYSKHVIALRRAADVKTITDVFNQINTTQMAIFFDEARSNLIPGPTTHYWEGFDPRVRAPTTQFHNKKLGKLLAAFHLAWSDSMNCTQDAIVLPGPRGDVKLKVSPNDNGASEARTLRFRKNASDTKRAFEKLIGYLKRKFPEFDYSSTDEYAFERYKKWMTD